MPLLILVHLHLLCLNAEIGDIRLAHEYRITRYSPVATVSLASNGARGVGLDENGNMIMFDKHGYVNLTTKHSLVGPAVSMAPSGKQLAFADRTNTLSILAADTLKPIAKQSFQNTIRQLHWLPSGKYIVVSMDNEEMASLISWDDHRFGKIVNDLKIPKSGRLVYAPDRDAFLFSLKPSRWAYMRVEEGKFRKSELNFETPGVQIVTVLGLSKTGIMVTAEDNRSYWRSITSPDQRVALPDTFNRNSAFLGVTPYYVELRHESLRATNIVTGRRIVKALKHSANPTTFSCAADGSTIAVGFEDGWVHIYETRMQFGPRELQQKE